MNGRGEPSGSTYGNDDYWADSFDAATDWFAPVKTEARTSVGLLDRPETQGYPASDHPSFPPGALKITPEDVYEALGAEAEDMLATAEIDIDEVIRLLNAETTVLPPLELPEGLPETDGSDTPPPEVVEAIASWKRRFIKGAVASVLAMLLIINFFVTSADSASVVLGSMSQRGSANPNKFVVVFWGVVIGGVAIVMLLTGGEDALSGLNNTTIIAASPFVVVVLAMCMALVKDLRSDPMVLREAKGAEVLEQAVIIGNEEHDGEFQLVTEPVENNGTESEGEPEDSGR